MLHGAILAEAQRTWVGNPPPETFGTSASWHRRGDGTLVERIRSGRARWLQIRGLKADITIHSRKARESLLVCRKLHYAWVQKGGRV